MPVIFVHGTGVRTTRLADLVATISAGLIRAGCTRSIKPYNYGNSSTFLRYGGISIPGQSEEQWRQQLGAIEQKTELPDLKSILRSDPLLELKSMRSSSAVGAHQARAAGIPERNSLLEVSAGPLKASLRTALAELDLGDNDVEIGVDLTTSSACQAGPTVRITHLVQPMVRALVAYFLTLLELKGTIVEWEQLESRIEPPVNSFLGGQAGIPFVGSLVMTPVLWGITHAARLARARIMASSTAFIGDILYYLSHRQAILDGLNAVVVAESGAKLEDLWLIGHSLGGVICMDYVMTYTRPVERLVTVGSQVGIMAEADVLCPGTSVSNMGDSPAKPIPLPESLGKWINIYDRNDFLSFRTSGIFDGVEEYVVDNGSPFPDCHSDYWRNPRVFEIMVQM